MARSSLVTVAAAGLDVETTTLDWETITRTGSSVAAARVAGIAALAIEANPSLTLSQLRQVLRFGVDPIAERRALASELGADEIVDPTEADVRAIVRDLTGSDGADLSFETSGSAAGQNGAVDCLRLGGMAVFVGFGVRD